MKNLFTLLFVCFSLFSFAQDISGGWSGSLSVQGTELPLVFNFTKTASGYTATMDSPNQGAKGILVSSISFENNNLAIELKVANIKYNGILKSNTEITGTFMQGSFAAPMNLTKGVVELERPQEPVKPYPYYTENVTFINTKESIQLAGTLTLPKKEGLFPAVILISGSGQQNRDSEILGHKPFLVIADYLTRNGIAVLRYDDRGVGESKGNPALSTSADFANDARAAIQYLRSRKEINTQNIGIIGHSEGGMIAPMLGAHDKNIAFIVLLAGPGVAGDLLLVNQNYEIGKLRGLTEEQLQEAKTTNQTIYNIVKAEVDLAAIKEKLTAHFLVSINKMPEEERTMQKEIDETLQREVDAIASPWLRYFISYNPTENLKKVKCPVLVLNGDKDVQVTAQINTAGIANALKNGGNKKVKVQIFPGLNHLFQKCITCKIEEYSTLSQTFSPDVLQTMSEWIQQQVK
jgi:hypothetical protein